MRPQADRDIEFRLSSSDIGVEAAAHLPQENGHPTRLDSGERHLPFSRTYFESPLTQRMINLSFVGVAAMGVAVGIPLGIGLEKMRARFLSR